MYAAAQPRRAVDTRTTMTMGLFDQEFGELQDI
jgi:hypothetical protein